MDISRPKRFKDLLAWVRYMRDLAPALRPHRYRAWRDNATMPEEWIAALERMFPVGGEADLQSLGKQAVNLGKAGVRNLASIARGNPATVTAEEQGRRKAVCEACPSGWYRPSDERCAHPKCNCFVKVKTWAHAERCPAGHW